MSLPALENWEETRDNLHYVAKVLGTIREQLVDPQPNYFHLCLLVRPEGFSTQPTPKGEVFFDVKQHKVIYQPDTGSPAQIDLREHSQLSLTDTLVRLLAEAGYHIQPDRSVLTETAKFKIDPGLASDYIGVLNTVYKTLKQFWETLPGKKTPPVLWPHHFDLSCLWFAGESADENDQHMNFGFAPYSPGLERPYLYSYAYPLPDGLTDLSLPTGTRWHSEGWVGTVTDYDFLRSQDEPQQVLEATLNGLYSTIAPMLFSHQ